MALVAGAGAMAAFAAGDADETADETAANVFLGELDLAERMEIWRNQFRRMTPGDAPLVQDVGTWPAAWEEFSHAWAVAPAERDLATWLVPVTAERSGALTVLRDADGNALWSGQTDFSKDESTNVTLTGTLVSEEDWTLYEATRAELARRMASESSPLRDGEGGGTNNPAPNPSNMFFSAYSVFTNGVPEFHVGLRWTNDVSMDIFAFGALHQATTNEVTCTNDENQVITTNVVRWHSVESGLTGRYDNLWEHVGTVSLTNLEEVVFADTNYVPERWIVRFYAAFESGDGDNDGLNDAFETTILETCTNSTDSDNDGLSEWDEYYVHRTNPNDDDTDHDGVDDPTELSMGLSPTKADTDGDLIIDGWEISHGTPPATSNVWWPMKTSTNAFYWEYIGDLPSWTLCENPKTNWLATTTSPWTNAIVKDVTITGFVDDAIKVDDHGVDWRCGTKRFGNVSITNEINDLQSGQFTLSLYYWPEEGYSGPNEVKLGDYDLEPFVAEWTWWKAFDVQMEPIWTTTGTSSLDNPSGIAPGSNAWFRVDVWPNDLIPETNIVWTSMYHKVEILQPDTGSRVQVHALEEGNDELVVTVAGAQDDLNLPPFLVQVKPLTLVTAVVGVVKMVDGPFAVDGARVTNDIRAVNQVLAQAAIQVVWDGAIRTIQDTDDNDYWDVASGSPQFTSLCSELSCPGGLEIYYVHGIDDISTSPAGKSSSNGIVIASSAATRTLAHEIGHVCGAKDIYIINPNNNQQLDVIAERSHMTNDWGHYMMDNSWNVPQSNIVQRLLMYGKSAPLKGDIPTGDVYGFRKYPYGTGNMYHLEMCPVGLSAMTNVPPVSY